MSVIQRWAPGKLRAVLAALPDIASIMHPSPASAAGGFNESFPVTGTTPCRLAGLTGPIEQTAAEQIASVTRWRLEVPDGTVIHPIDRVSVNGKTFEVAGALNKETLAVTDTYYLVEILQT